jgi:hypothetical protein
MWEISPRVNSPKNDDPTLWELIHAADTDGYSSVTRAKAARLFGMHRSNITRLLARADELLELEAGRQWKQLRSLWRREKLATRTRPWVQDLAYNFLQTEE